MMEDLDAAGVAEEDTTGKAKRRLEAGRRLVFGNARARVAVLLAVADLLVAIVFALLPDTRVESSTANSDQRFAAVFITQVTLSWLNVAIGTVLLGVLWVTYSVPKRRVTFERLGYLWYVVVGKMAQMLSDVALLGYPNPIRLIVVVANFLLCLLQVVWNLRSVRLSRELFTRKLRPPLVIKALLDMKGDTLSAADPLTLGMLERLEGIVKVREQMKFNVKHGRCAAARRNSARNSAAQLCAILLTPAPSPPQQQPDDRDDAPPRLQLPLLLVGVHQDPDLPIALLLAHPGRADRFALQPLHVLAEPRVRKPQRVHGQRIVLAVQHRRRRRVRGLRDAEDDDERAAAAGAQRRPARRPRRRGWPLRRA